MRKRRLTDCRASFHIVGSFFTRYKRRFACFVFFQEDARCENLRQTAVPVSKKQEVLTLLHPSVSSRTDRGAIRPHSSQNRTGISKDAIYRNKMASLLYGLNTPLFLPTLHRSRIGKKS